MSADFPRRRWRFCPMKPDVPAARRAEICQWRFWFAHEVLYADSESLDDGPRPSDLHTGEK